jgi:hypothetical protein
MIEITPAIIGPGIEEEYQDALDAIEAIRNALGPTTLTNDRPDGRLLLNVMVIEQEIKAGRLPIPLDRSYTGTTDALVGHGDLDHVPGFELPLAKLYTILHGIGLFKERHRAVLLSMIDDFVHDAHQYYDTITQPERDLIDRFAAIRQDIAAGLTPPIGKEYGLQGQQWPNRDELKRQVPDFLKRLFRISEVLDAAYRPLLARNGPLQPPVPGFATPAPVLPQGMRATLP